MGLFDDLKKAATSVAGEMKTAASTIGTEAGKQSRLAQAQLKLRSLQGDVGDAQKALGAKVYDMAEQGQISLTELAPELAAVREAKAAVTAKEAEIEAIKAEDGGMTGGQQTESTPPPTGPDSTGTPGSGSTEMPGTQPPQS